jgi:DNA (cytosine-5)-methyltransferase 1
VRCGSLFSGIGGMDYGLAKAGFDHVFFAESDAYRRRVLMRHWPGVPVYDDVRSVGVELAGGRQHPEAVQPAVGGVVGDSRLDLLCGGFPCQDLSVAGRRAGLVGKRSGLFFEFARVADDLVRDGGWIVVENVPGLLSSQGGRDFGIVLASLAELGFHDLAWRVLDSRYFGVPQRRRRVFVVGRRASGDGARQVLLEPESGGGNFETGRKAGTRVAAPLTRGSSGAGVSEPGQRQEDDINIVSTLQGGAGRRGHRIDAEGAGGGHPIAHTLRSEGFDASEDGTGRGTRLTVHGQEVDPDGVREAPGAAGRVDDPGGGIAGPITRRYGKGINTTMDDAALVVGGGSGSVIDLKPDGPRYAGCGDAVTSSVAFWVGRRILEYENGG